MEASPATVSAVRRVVPSATRVGSTQEQREYWSEVLSHWQLPQQMRHFPGPNPVSIERKDIAAIREDDYIVALKTDGVRYLLLLTISKASNEPMAVMIDRALNMYEVEVWANEAYFTKGTLFDGELVWDNGGSLSFIIFDVVAISGQSCVEMPYRDRLQAIHSSVLCVDASYDDERVECMVGEEDKLIARNNDNRLRIYPKVCVPKAQAHTLWEQRLHCSHQNDGLILTRNAAAIGSGTSDSIFKWKPTHSIDLRGIFRAEVWSFFANENRSGNEVDVTEECGGYRMRYCENGLLETLRRRENCVIEFLIHIDGDGVLMTPERERPDKTTANTVRTILATFRNAIENIGDRELLACL